MCLTEEKSDVSGPIRSVKCVVVFNVLCRGRQYYGAMTCLVHMEQGPIPLRPGHPPSPPCLATGNSVCLQLSRRMDLDSVVDNREQPIPEPVATGQCMCILFFISHLVIMSFGISLK
jgi:hypothetical protein